MKENVGSDDICQEIKDTVELIDEMEKKGIVLKPSGTSRYQCVCPFHSDTDPSMTVNLNGDFQWFYCHGCKATGSVIDFVMLYQKKTLSSAIRYFEENYSLMHSKTSTLKDLIEKPRKKKRRLSVLPKMINISNIVYSFSKWCNDPQDAIFVVQPYLEEIDGASFARDFQRIDVLTRKLNECIVKIKERKK